MRFRKLRIAWSGGCGIACVLLIALWVRSYSCWDTLYGPLFGGKEFAVSTSIDATPGLKVLWYIPRLFGSQKVKWRFETDFSFKMTDAHANFTIYGMSIYRGFVTGFMVPFWFLAFVSATTAVLPWLPWIKWRFGLRTLLIATTLVALALGLIIFALR
jgi:hypothetical protein